MGSVVGERSQLVLPALNFRPQVVLRVALSDVLYEWAVIREEVGCDMDGLGVPNLAVLQAELLGVERREESKFSTDAEVGDNDV